MYWIFSFRYPPTLVSNIIYLNHCCLYKVISHSGFDFIVDNLEHFLHFSMKHMCQFKSCPHFFLDRIVWLLLFCKFRNMFFSLWIFKTLLLDDVWDFISVYVRFSFNYYILGIIYITKTYHQKCAFEIYSSVIKSSDPNEKWTKKLSIFPKKI